MDGQAREGGPAAAACGADRTNRRDGAPAPARGIRTSMISETYQEHVLDAADVCQSCFRLIRVERVDPTRSGMATEYEEHLARHERHTEIAYGPAERVTEQKGVFCECGTESAFDRYRDPADVHDPGCRLDRERFKDLAVTCLQTLQEKGLSLDERTFIARALAELDDGRTIDESLSQATDHALAVATTDGLEADA